MTPTQLCDLAAKINAAVPGLVKDFKTVHGWYDIVQMHESKETGYRHMLTSSAAAMMLGMVAAKWQLMTYEERSEHDDLESCMNTLHAYVATTLPGAKQ